MNPVVQSTTSDVQELLIDREWRLVRSTGALFVRKGIGQVNSGRSLQHILGPFWNRDLKRMCTDALERGISSTKVFERLRRGVTVVLSFACAPFVDHGRVSGFLLTIRDVTARTRLEAQRDLRDRMQMISHIASHIGHKMNSPIAAVLNRIGGLLMHDNGDMDTASLRRELESIQEQLYAVSLITIGLTAFSNGNGADKKLVQMSDVLQNALHLMRLVDSQHKIQFNVDVDEPLPRILGDDITLEQCIVNICKNAVEAMPNGGRISITAKVDEMFPDFINIKIQDNGPGMTPDQVARAFEPFYTTKKRQHGLGLSVCFAVVSSHDGGIELSSREKSGTTVQIVLPIAQLN